MEKITVLNMPSNVVFQFASRHYIWKVTRDGTRNGNYKGNISEYVEIFTRFEDGPLWCEWSGTLIYNPALYNEEGLDKDNCFYIFSHDANSGRRFHQVSDLSLAPETVTAEITALEPTIEKTK